MLAATSSLKLAPYIKQTFSLDDWQRVAAEVPTLAQERHLREEQNRLMLQRQKAIALFEQGHQNQRKQQEIERDQLIRQCFLQGLLELRPKTTAIKLWTDAGQEEELLWESPAEKWKARTSQGSLFWEREAFGILIVTSQRVWFQGEGTRWQRALKKLVSVQMMHTANGRVMLLLYIDGLQKPIGFIVENLSVSFKVDNHQASITAMAKDLHDMLHLRIL